jgi:hypothetical protein
MKTYILNLSDSTTAKFVYHTTILNKVSVICDIPIDIDCLKVIGTIDFKSVVFDWTFYNAIKKGIEILDLSELKSSGSYSHLSLGLNDCLGGGKFKEIILPDKLENMPMIRNFPGLRKIVGLGLTTFNNEIQTDCMCSPNLSFCPKLEEIIFGANIKTITIRNSSIKRIIIPETNELLQLEPYGLAYNKELEEVHIPQKMKVLPIRLFEGCIKLKTITGGNGLEEIGFGSFGGCINLQSVPFRIELLKENQFLSYDEWMQYEPEDHKTSHWSHGDCSQCPKGERSEKHGWKAGCNLKKYYCRDNDQRKWKPYKKGVVLNNGYIWCFDDFTYYETNLKDDDWFWHKPKNMHKYVEFISPNITFTSEDNHVKINYKPQEKKALELTFPHNKLAETIDMFFEDISYELILDEITRKVEDLDIDDIIDSYRTEFSHEYFKMNSDTEGERYSLNRDAKYTDDYLINLLPPIHENYDDRMVGVANISDYKNPYKNKFNFNMTFSTYGKKKDDDLFVDDIFPSYSRTRNILSGAANISKEDAEIRKDAREKYSRKDHVDYLVNCRISEIINRKLEIESRLHIKQAENEFYKKCVHNDPRKMC